MKRRKANIVNYKWLINPTGKVPKKAAKTLIANMVQASNQLKDEIKQLVLKASKSQTKIPDKDITEIVWLFNTFASKLNEAQKRHTKQASSSG